MHLEGVLEIKYYFWKYAEYGFDLGNGITDRMIYLKCRFKFSIIFWKTFNIVRSGIVSELWILKIRSKSEFYWSSKIET